MHDRFFLLVWLWFYVPLENFSLIWRRRHYRWRVSHFYLDSAFMVIEQWWFFSVPHLLWQGVSVYNGHLRGPVTLTPVAQRFADSGAVTTCFYLRLSRLGFEHPTFRMLDKSMPIDKKDVFDVNYRKSMVWLKLF